MLILTKHQSPITNHQSPITNHQSPITNHQSPITNHQSPITNHQSPITNHQSPITNHQSPITNHQSLLIHLPKKTKFPISKSPHQQISKLIPLTLYNENPQPIPAVNLVHDRNILSLQRNSLQLPNRLVEI